MLLAAYGLLAQVLTTIARCAFAGNSGRCGPAQSLQLPNCIVTLSLRHRLILSYCVLQLTVLDPVEVLQLCPERRCKWISYSAYDAKATWQLSQALKAKLKVQSTQSVDCGFYVGEHAACCSLAHAKIFPAFPWMCQRLPSESRAGRFACCTGFQ